MKKVILIGLILTGCSSLKLHKKPCDLVTGREDVFVCGKSDVVKGCRPVLGHDEVMVCE